MLRSVIGFLVMLLLSCGSGSGDSLMPGDPLANVDTIELTIVYGGSLGLGWEKSLFAANPHLAPTLKPCLDELLKDALSRRSVSIVPEGGGATEASCFTSGLSLGIFGRPM